MNIILFGAPGVGKGTQAARLASSHNLLHISTGDILRSAIATGTPLGVTARRYVESGGLVPDEVIIGLVKEVLQTHSGQGFLLDGFPRTLEQARALEDLFRELGIEDVRVVMLRAPEAELVRRMLQRGEELGRKDDTPETITHRFKVYQTQTKPVQEFYERLRDVDMVDGLGEVSDVTQRIAEVLTKKKVST